MTAYVSPRGTSLMIWMIVFTVIIIVILALRYYAARLQDRSLRLDDVFILVAYISLIAMEGTTFWGIANGLGAHGSGAEEPQLNASQKIVLAKLMFSTGWTWKIATVCCKLAMLAFFNVIFRTRNFLLASYTLMACCVSYALIFIPIFNTECSPPAAAWNPALGHCRPIQSEEYASVAVNMVLDLAVVMLPLPTIWNLQMSRKRKIGISLLFSLGLLIVGVMAWRIQNTYYGAHTADPLYNIYFTALLSHLEIWLGITAASLPTLAPIASRVIIPTLSRYVTPRLRRSRSSSRRHSGARKIGADKGSSHSDDMPLRSNKFQRLDESNVIELSGVHHSSAEAAKKISPFPVGGNEWSDDRDKIAIRDDIEVFVEPPRQLGLSL